MTLADYLPVVKMTQDSSGIGTFSNEVTPKSVTQIQGKVVELSCGYLHTLVLTKDGEVYTMGDNKLGQLGTGLTELNGNPVPTFVKELKFTKIVKVRAGSFSAALSEDR